MTVTSEILTVEELQAYLKIPKPTIYAMAQNGRIPAAKIGKHWRFRKVDIDQWLESRRWDRLNRHQPTPTPQVSHVVERT